MKTVLLIGICAVGVYVNAPTVNTMLRMRELSSLSSSKKKQSHRILDIFHGPEAKWSYRCACGLVETGFATRVQARAKAAMHLGEHSGE